MQLCINGDNVIVSAPRGSKRGGLGLSIPKGSVATYGQVAAAAGFPLYHRAVARVLRTTPASQLPWQRVIGAGGEIKLRQEAGAEQRLRLQMEGVAFRGRRVDLEKHQHTFRTWELD